MTCAHVHMYKAILRSSRARTRRHGGTDADTYADRRTQAHTNQKGCRNVQGPDLECCLKVGVVKLDRSSGGFRRAEQQHEQRQRRHRQQALLHAGTLRAKLSTKPRASAVAQARVDPCARGARALGACACAHATAVLRRPKAVLSRPSLCNTKKQPVHMWVL